MAISREEVKEIAKKEAQELVSKIVSTNCGICLIDSLKYSYFKQVIIDGIEGKGKLGEKEAELYISATHNVAVNCELPQEDRESVERISKKIQDALKKSNFPACEDALDQMDSVLLTRQQKRFNYEGVLY